MTSFGFTNSRPSFHQRLKVDLRYFSPAFLQELPEVSCTSGLLSSEFLVKFIPHQFNGIYISLLRRPRHQLKNVLFLFSFNVLLAELTTILWVIALHEYKCLIHKPSSRRNSVMLQSVVIASLI